MINDAIRFLGAYVTDVSVSAGWNGENSSCSLTLVEENDDPARPGKKIDDVEFQPPAIGTACMLKIRDLQSDTIFKFGGILQRYTFLEDVSGGRRWEVELNSPSSFLDGVFIILDGFIGTVYTNDTDNDQPSVKPLFPYAGLSKTDYLGYTRYTPSNLINLFAYKENKIYGGAGAGFGSADVNSLGYPVSDIVADLTECCRSSNFGGKIRFSDTLYDIDFSGLQPAIENLGDFRIKTDIAIDLNTLMKNLSDVSLYDYYVYIDENDDPNNLMKADELGVMKNAIIKIKLLSRKAPPDGNQIKKIIDSFKDKPDLDKNLKSYRIGKELNSDMVTQKVLLGDRASRHWFATKPYILPVWGKKGTGDNTTFYYGSSVRNYLNPFSNITCVVDALDMTDGGAKNSFVQEGDFVFFKTNLLELRCAMSGRATWDMYHKLFFLAYKEALKENRSLAFFNKFNYRSPFDFRSMMARFRDAKDIRDIFGGKGTTHDLLDTSVDTAELLTSYMFGTRDAQKDQLQRAINTRFNGLKMAAEEFYGKAFLVATPTEPGGIENNFRWVQLDQKPEYMWDTASSAWAGDNVTKYIDDASFYEDGAGRLKSIVGYPIYKYDAKWGGVLADYSALGHDYVMMDWKDTPSSTPKKIVAGYTNIDTSWRTRFLDIGSVNYGSSDWPAASTDLQPVPSRDSTGRELAANTLYGFSKVTVPPVEIYDKLTTESNAFGVLAKLIFQDDAIIGGATRVGYQNLFGSEGMTDQGIAPAMMPPDVISIPQQSTRYVWGPWWSFSDFDAGDTAKGKQIANAGRSGKVDVKVETDLKPETFGSIYNMNVVAQQICDAELISTHATETGYVELAEIPKFNLADKIFDVGPYITDIKVTVNADGFNTVYNFTTWTKKPGELARYNYKRLITSNKETFRLSQEIRNVIRKGKLPPVNKALLKSIEKKQAQVAKVSTSAMFGQFSRGLASAINGPKPGESGYKESGIPSLNAHSSSTQSAMSSYGFSPEETFGSSYEQIYSPVYVWNQRFPQEHKVEYNEGLFVLRNTDNNAKRPGEEDFGSQENRTFAPEKTT